MPVEIPRRRAFDPERHPKQLKGKPIHDSSQISTTWTAMTSENAIRGLKITLHEMPARRIEGPRVGNQVANPVRVDDHRPVPFESPDIVFTIQ